MRKTVFVVLVALAVLAAMACQSSLTGPSPDSHASATGMKTASAGSATTISDAGFVGTWQAIKAEGTNHWDPNIRRDLVAEGGKVTLVLEAGEEFERAFTVTLTMPGEAPRINYGIWHYWIHDGRPQIDFWPGSIPKEDLEYGDGVGMYADLIGNTLTLSDGGGKFLLYDFGWHDSYGHDWAHLELVLTRN